MSIKHTWLLFFGMALGPFMVGIDLLAIAIAIEPMTQALAIGIATLQWFLTAYAIGNSSFLVTSGKMADLYGKKKILLIGLAIFVLSSGAIALSSSPLFIIFARLIQGVSGGILPVVAIATFMALYEGHERTKWISRIVGASGLGMVVGPAVGGFLIHHLSWRWIFLINLPVGILAILLVIFFMPKLKKTPHVNEKIDVWGIIFFTAILILFNTAISQGHAWGWTSLKIVSLFIATAILVMLFVRHEIRIKSPLVDFQLFKVQNFLSAGFAGFVIYFALTAWILIFGIYLQRVMGLTAEQAGYIFLPFGLVLVIVSSQMGKLSKKFGPKKLIVFGFIPGFLSFLGLGLIPLFPSYILLVILFAFFGLCFVLVNSNSVPATLQYMPPEKMGVASGKSMMMRWFGGALGAAMISAIFMTHSTHRLENLIENTPLIAQQSTLHDVLIGEEKVGALQTTFQGENLQMATQIIDKAYHHGLAISCFALSGLCLLALLSSQIFIGEKDGN